jgi:hypothetical protein
VYAFDCELLESCHEVFLTEVFGEGFDRNCALSHKILYKTRSLISHKRRCSDKYGFQLEETIEKQV